jgi:hypothetical protein
MRPGFGAGFGVVVEGVGSGMEVMFEVAKNPAKFQKRI